MPYVLSMKNRIQHWYPSMGFIFVAFLLTNSVALLDLGIFWDDWSIYNASENSIRTQFDGTGLLYLARFHMILQQTSEPALMYNIVTFVLEAMSILMLYRTFSALGFARSFFSWLILFFAVMPFYSANNTMICLPYDLHLCLFYLGFLCLVLDSNLPRNWLRSTALLSFILSFLINSLLVYYLIPMAVLYYLQDRVPIRSYRKLLDPRRVLYFIRMNIDYIAVPVVFIFIKMKWLKPTGIFADMNYNQVSGRLLLTSLLKCFIAIKTSFIGLFSSVMQSFLDASYIGIFGLLVGMVFLYFFLKKNQPSGQMQTIKRKRWNQTFVLGLVIFLIGAYPYFVVLKTPLMEGFESRHQLLLPLGASMMVVSLIHVCMRISLVKMTLLLTVIAMMVTSIRFDFQYCKSWFKQESMIHEIRINPIRQMANTYIFLDDFQTWNVDEEGMSLIALNGIMKYALENEENLLCTYEQYHTKYWAVITKELEFFNMKDYEFSDFKKPALMKLIPSEKMGTGMSEFSLLNDYYFSPSDYDENIAGLTRLQLQKSHRRVDPFFLD